VTPRPQQLSQRRLRTALTRPARLLLFHAPEGVPAEAKAAAAAAADGEGAGPAAEAAEAAPTTTVGAGATFAVAARCEEASVSNRRPVLG
jgi:hypothetical protein